MRQAIDPILEWKIPQLYGGVPTAFGAPLSRDTTAWPVADLAVVGIPWNAPHDGTRRGMAASNFDGTSLTPHEFRRNSIKYGGYLPELDVDVFSEFSLVDTGDVVVSTADTKLTLENVARRIASLRTSGLIPITIGGNSGPSSYSVLDGLWRASQTPVRVLHLDAHSDCRPIDTADDSPESPQWGGAWVWRLLHSPYASGDTYFHVGLRGPRNHPDTFRWLESAGVPRSNVTTYRELRAARRTGDALEQMAILGRQIAGSSGKLWIGLDVDALDLGTSLEFGDECLGPTVPEVAELFNAIGVALGRDRVAGLSIMAMPYQAQSLHAIIVYLLLYFLAGVAGHGL